MKIRVVAVVVGVVAGCVEQHAVSIDPELSDGLERTDARPAADASTSNVGTPTPDSTQPERDVPRADVSDIGASDAPSDASAPVDGPMPSGRADFGLGVDEDATLGARILACSLRYIARNHEWDAPFVADGDFELFGFRFGQLSPSFFWLSMSLPTATCVMDIGGVNRRNWPLAAISDLAMIPEKVMEEDGVQEIGFLNPLLVQWAGDHLLPKPEEPIGGVTARVVYQKIFSSYARKAAEAYLFLHDEGMYVHEVSELRQWLASGSPAERGDECPPGMAFISNIETWRHLACRFADLPSPDGVGWGMHGEGNGNTCYCSESLDLAYFWLRRGLDETNDEVWAVLAAGLQAFDPDWYAELPIRFPDAQVGW